MPAAALAIPAAISAGSSIASGVLGSRAAKKAGQIQSEAATTQSQDLLNMLRQVNPEIAAAAERAMTGLRGEASSMGGWLRDVAGEGAEEMRGSATAANELLTPYTGLGADAASMMSEFMKGPGQREFTAADMEAYDPGYQFRLDEQQKLLEKSAAAKGGVLGGGTAKALARYGQNLASSEFGNAFDRFMRQQDTRYSRINNLLGMGLNASNAAGSNLMNAAQNAAMLNYGGAQTAGGWNVDAARQAGQWGVGAADLMGQNALQTQRNVADLMTGGAASRAAGTVGSANAWGNALGGIGNTAMQVGQWMSDKDLVNQMGSGGGGYAPQASIYTPPAPPRLSQANLGFGPGAQGWTYLPNLQGWPR